MVEPGIEYPSDGGWEYELTPERAQLKETANLLSEVMNTLTFSGDPKRTIAAFAEEFVRHHLSELPPAVIQELTQRRTALLTPPPAESIPQ